MMKLVLGLTISIASLVFIGCKSMDNRSLEYKKSYQLKPLTIPDSVQMRTPTPLYPAPNIEQYALENAPQYANQQGSRFQLPRPAIPTDAPSSASNLNTNDGQTGLITQPVLANLRPHFIADGHRNPFLQIGGDHSTVWKYITATLNSLNYQLTPLTNASVIIDKNGEQYVIQLNKVGSTNVLAVYDQNKQLAPQEVANEILTQIYQNWPV